MSVMTTGPLEIREDETDVLAEGKRVGLTVREFEVLLALAARPDRVVQRPDIYREVWNAQMPYRDRAVDVFVRKVRQKLDDAAPDWTFIHTHFGGAIHISTDPCGKGRPKLAVSVADSKGRVAGPYRLVSSRNGGSLTGCPARSSHRR